MPSKQNRDHYREHRHINFLLVLGVMQCSLAIYAGNVSARDTDEPALVTRSSLGKLLTSKQVFYKQGTYRNLGGMGIKLASVQANQLMLEVTVDRKLNLWRGRPNDLASAHGGKMEMRIKSIIDSHGKELYAPEKEQTWEKRVTIYRKDDGTLRGTRRAFLKHKTNMEEIRAIKGALKLTVPVGYQTLQLDLSREDALRKASWNSLISKASFKDNRLYLQHPRILPHASFVLKGVDSKGKTVPVVGTGIAGSKPNNHWYSFKQDTAVKNITLWITNDRFERDLRFHLKN